MSRENVAAAKRIYQARNRGDVDAVLAECAPDVTWRPHLAALGGKPIRGHDEVRAYMASLQEDWEGFRHEPEEFFDAGDKVVAFLHTYARGPGSGVEVEVPVAAESGSQNSQAVTTMDPSVVGARKGVLRGGAQVLGRRGHGRGIPVFRG